jgi:putative FmdB family regulatory protein
MPIYEFLCTACGDVSEVLVFGEATVISCPTCGGQKLQRLLSVTSTASGFKSREALPGPQDTACCGSRPGMQGCTPGSCCGKSAG